MGGQRTLAMLFGTPIEGAVYSGVGQKRWQPALKLFQDAAVGVTDFAGPSRIWENQNSRPEHKLEGSNLVGAGPSANLSEGSEWG